MSIIAQLLVKHTWSLIDLLQICSRHFCFQHSHDDEECRLMLVAMDSPVMVNTVEDELSLFVCLHT